MNNIYLDLPAEIDAQYLAVMNGWNSKFVVNFPAFRLLSQEIRDSVIVVIFVDMIQKARNK